VTFCLISNTDDLGVMVVRNLLIKLIRDRLPDARIVVLADAAIVEKVRRFHQQASWVDACVALDERPKTRRQQWRLWRTLRAQRADVLIVSPDTKLPLWIPYLCAIPRRVGLCTAPAQRRFLSHPVTVDVPVDDRDLHWAPVLAGYARALGFADFAGAAAHVPFVRVPPSFPGSWPARGEGPRIVLHVGGNAQWNRRWPLRHFLQLCRRLVRDAGATLCLLGTSDEAPENRAIVTAVTREDREAAVVDLSGAPLPDTIRHVAQADLFIGNDSGPMNIAVAVGTPVIAIRGADAENFRPDTVDPRHVVFSNWTNCARYINGTNRCDAGCPVAYDRRRQDYPKCMAAIPPDDVWRAVVHHLRLEATSA
jgi:ADP-heptose:LPS heptosyltransferase